MYFKLMVLYCDDTFEEIIVKRFSDLSTSKSKFYYYEKPCDEHGKGTCIDRSNVKCVECVFNN